MGGTDRVGNAVQPGREDIGGGQLSGRRAGAGGGRGSGAVYMEGGLETSESILGRVRVGGLLGLVGSVFGVLGWVFQVWGGGKLGEGGEGALDGEVGLLFVRCRGEGECLGGVLLGDGGAGVGGRGEGGAFVVVEVVVGVYGGGRSVGGEMYGVGRKGLLGVEGVVEGVVEEGGPVGSVGEVVPVKVGGVVIAGQDQILLLGLVNVMVVAPIEMDHG